MLPRLYSGPSHRISKAGLARHARVASTNKQAGVSRHTVVEANCRLVLRPTGNGSYDHIGDEVPLPQTIPLKDGVFEVGRAAPADIQINVPTVSSRHALLRVGTSNSPRCSLPSGSPDNMQRKHVHDDHRDAFSYWQH